MPMRMNATGSGSGASVGSAFVRTVIVTRSPSDSISSTCGAAIDRQHHALDAAGVAAEQRADPTALRGVEQRRRFGREREAHDVAVDRDLTRESGWDRGCERERGRDVEILEQRVQPFADDPRVARNASASRSTRWAPKCSASTRSRRTHQQVRLHLELVASAMSVASVVSASVNFGSNSPQ